VWLYVKVLVVVIYCSRSRINCDSPQLLCHSDAL